MEMSQEPVRLDLFEGVCLTTVILTPGACGGRLRAAAREIDWYVSAGSGGSTGVFRKRRSCCVLQNLRARDHRAIAPAALGGCGGLGQLWEALAELREALGELWEGLECDLNS